VAYAANTDLLLEFKGVSAWNASTVSAATVDEWCAQASNTIDAAIGGKYSTPVDGTASPKAFSVLKSICIGLVKPRVQSVLKSGTGEAKTSTSAGSAPDPTKAQMDLLKQIQSGAMTLSDAVLGTSADGVESYTNDNADTLQPPTFTREGNDW
jgi:phage gp36-like protein